MDTRVLSPSLQSALEAFGEAADQLGRLMITQLAETDPHSIESLSAAAASGSPAVLMIDMGTGDLAVRLATIAPDQRVTQVAVIGHFSPSDKRN